MNDFKNNLEKLYNEFLNNINNNKIEFDYFSNYFTDLELKLYKSISLDDLDINWLSPIEASLLSFDTIIRNPSHTIKNEEEIVQIEKSKNFSIDSVKHLAKHSQYIAKYNEETITPSKILHNSKEDSISTYENRFVFTLLKRLELFIDKRLDLLKKNYLIEDSSELNVLGKTNIDNGIFSFDIKLRISEIKKDFDYLYDLNYDTTNLNAFLRIKRILGIISGFFNTPFYRTLKKEPLLNTNITMTNLLLNNPNFKNLVNLWEYLNNYNESKNNESIYIKNNEILESFKNETKSILSLNYISLYKAINSETNELIVDNLDNGNLDHIDFINKKELVYKELTYIKLKEENEYIKKMKEIVKRALKYR